MKKRRSPSYDPYWKEKFQDRLLSPEGAVARIGPGKRIFIGTGCAQPETLLEALTARAKELPDTELVQLLTLGAAPYASKELAHEFRINSFFIAENVRDLVQEGLGDYTPVFLSDIPRLFNSGRFPLDVALIQVTPPDEQGRCSLGISVDIVKSAAENASLVIAQVNPRMPRTLGETFLSAYDLDIMVPTDKSLAEVKPPKHDKIIRTIAQNIAGLVEDGATLELGIGRIPHAVLEYLFDKKDLGIHTELLTDAVIPLLKAGVITGSRKTLDRQKVVASFCMGTRKLYDLIDNNPSFSFHPTEYVNDPMVIGRQHRMVSVNVALEVDLTGQVCSDSLGTRFFAGIGGQVDFNRGAAAAPGGKAIIAMPSTAREGTISRIVTRLTPGAGVVTTRGDVHYVVTEYGVAYLHGKKIAERTLALISVAHPKFRDRLVREAIEAKYLSQELSEVEGKILLAPPHLETSHVLKDGTLMKFRPIHPTDIPRMKDLFYRLSQETIYYRFMENLIRAPKRYLRNFIFVDHRKDAAIVGTLPAPEGEEIVAVGRYYLDEKTNRAEVAFTVRDDWQGLGIGKFLLKQLTTIARKNGISGFSAQVLAENRAMQAVFERSGLKVRCTLSHGVYQFEMDFE